MKKSIVSAVSALALAGGLCAAARPAGAAEGSWLVRGNLSVVDPGNDSDEVSGFSRSGVQFEPSGTLSLSGSYFVNDYVGLELATALPSETQLRGNGRMRGLGIDQMADVTVLPATFSVQLHIPNPTPLTPYLGVGVNYTHFYEEDSRINGLDVKVDDAWGLAGKIGLDANLGAGLLLGANVQYINMTTTAKFSGVIDDNVDMQVDPWIYSVGLGYRF